MKLVLSHYRKNIRRGILFCSYPCTIGTVSDKPQQTHGYENDRVYRSQTGKKYISIREHQIEDTQRSAVISFNKVCTTYRLAPKFININMTALVGAYLI